MVFDIFQCTNMVQGGILNFFILCSLIHKTEPNNNP